MFRSCNITWRWSWKVESVHCVNKKVVDRHLFFFFFFINIIYILCSIRTIMTKKNIFNYWPFEHQSTELYLLVFFIVHIIYYNTLKAANFINRLFVGHVRVWWQHFLYNLIMRSCHISSTAKFILIFFHSLN